MMVQKNQEATASPSADGINHGKRNRLRDIKVFVLDNSLRESTVGQVVGHSLSDKFAISEAVTSCGYKHQIVAAFSSQRRVDDAFCKKYMDGEPNAEDFRYAFTEYSDTNVDGEMLFGPDHIPIGLQKMKQYGISHPIIEIDVAYDAVDWDGKFSTSKMHELFTFLFQWVKDNLRNDVGCLPKGHCFVNLRDFPLAMVHQQDRVLKLVQFLANLPTEIRPVGLLFEEPMGEYFTDEVGGWTQTIRKTMDDHGWSSQFQKDGKTVDGLLLVHVHKQWGMADAVVLEALASGADGIWASVSEEGAAMGHACSAVTLANLARLGNRDVVERYHTRKLAAAARKVTERVINEPVAERQLVYGPRAIDAVFGFGGIAGGANVNLDYDGDGEIDHFSLAKFLGVDDPPVRISTLASPGLIVKRLKQLFGEDNPLFDEAHASKLLVEMKRQLENNIEEEHSSAMGLAMLWESTFNTVPPAMFKVLEQGAAKSKYVEELLQEAKSCFEDYLEEDGSEKKKKKGLTYTAFYEAYLQPFMGCFSCPDTRFVLDALNLYQDGTKLIEWSEWRIWCLWALRTMPEQIRTVDQLHQCVLRNAILPQSCVIQDKKKKTKQDDSIKKRKFGEVNRTESPNSVASPSALKHKKTT